MQKIVYSMLSFRLSSWISDSFVSLNALNHLWVLRNHFAPKLHWSCSCFVSHNFIRFPNKKRNKTFTSTVFCFRPNLRTSFSLAAMFLSSYILVFPFCCKTYRQILSYYDQYCPEWELLLVAQTIYQTTSYSLAQESPKFHSTLRRRWLNTAVTVSPFASLPLCFYHLIRKIRTSTARKIIPPCVSRFLFGHPVSWWRLAAASLHLPCRTCQIYAQWKSAPVTQTEFHLKLLHFIRVRS